MTDTLDAAEGLTGKPNVAAGFRAWHRPISMLNRICDKKILCCSSFAGRLGHPKLLESISFSNVGDKH